MKFFYSCILSFLVFFVFGCNFIFSQTHSVVFTSTGTWTCPSGVSTATVECWGGGGAGGGGITANPAAGGGGSAGAYAKAALTVTAGTTYNVTVGAGGTASTGNGGAGGATNFNNATTLKAVGGNGGTGATTTTPAAGAAAVTSGNVGGTTNFYGGAGGTGASNATSGGGGGSASTTANGTDAVSGTAGTGSATGGAGVTTNAVGNVGGVPGAGGSGARRTSGSKNGGAGGAGQVIITYTDASSQEPAITAFSQLTWCNSVYPSTYQTVSFSLSENDNANFNPSQTGTIILSAPAGFEFNTAAGPTITFTAGRDITSATLTSVTTSAITITVTTDATPTQADVINFNNFQIRATAAGSGDVTRSGGTFLINSLTTIPSSTESFGHVLATTSPTYTTSSVSQYSTANITRGCSSTKNPILEIQINITGDLTCAAANVTQFVFSTAGNPGSTNAATDISTAEVYYTGQTQGFNTNTFFGSVSNPVGSFTVTGTESLTLGAGTHYFYLAYNVPGTATAGDVVDASMTSFTFNGSVKTDMATPNPAGSRTIVAGSCPPSVEIPAPTANTQTITAGSWVIPMDNSHQNLFPTGSPYPFNIKSYGLIRQLLQNDIPVKWIIKSGKAKDASDFVANASRVYPSVVAAATQTFVASAFVVDSFYLDHSFYPGGQTATQVAASFAPLYSVAVYKLTADVAVDVRYTMTHRPKIAAFNNGTYETVAKKLLDSAKVWITGIDTALGAGAFTGLAECYTFCTEMHWSTATLADSATMRNVWDFVNEGGNFLGQCAGENAYENFMQPNRHFHTSQGTTEHLGPLATNYYANPDMSFMQFEGTLAPRLGQTGDWTLTAGSAYSPASYKCVTSVTGDTVVASVAHFGNADSVGGNVFYLGGHDYMTTTSTQTASDQRGVLTYINGCRMFLNAALTPAGRPTSFPLSLGSNPTICSGQSTTIGPVQVSGTTYVWSPSTGLNNTTDANPIASPTVTTAYTVTGFQGACIMGPSTMTVVVNATPAAPTTSATPNPICTGSTLSLTASATGTTYNWNGPNSFTSTSRTPSFVANSTAYSGTYSVTATTAGCTSPTSTISVTVNQTPTSPTASASPTVICTGNTLSLSASATGSTYNWTGPNSFTSTSQNPTLSITTTAQGGTYSVTATTTGCTSSAGTVSVTVNATPTFTTSPSNNSPICSGQSLTLVAPSVGITYSWSGPNSFTSSLQNPVINPAGIAADGIYTVTATSNGCSSSAVTTATVNATPSAPTASATPSVICTNNTLSLSSSGSGSSYNWTGPNSFTSATQNPSLSITTTTQGGTYSVTTTSGAGCVSSAATVSVTVNQTPSAPTPGSNTPVCSGQTLSLTSNTIAGASYNWNGPNSFTSSLQNPPIANVTTAASGTYTISATVSGCTSSTATTSVTINQTPAAPTAGSNSPICAGQTLSLTSNTVASATYNWSGPNSFTSSLQNPPINNASTAASGTYSVHVTVGGCTGANGTTAVTVNPIPSAPTPGSNTPVCSGQTLSLTSNTIASATYSWSGPNSFTSSLQNPPITNVTTAAGGTYTLNVTVSGCTSSTATTSVTINQTPAAPTAGSNSPLCVNQTLNLTSTGSGSSYSWSGPNSFASALQNPTLAITTTAQGGTYSVTTTSAAGCISSTTTISVVVNPIPSAPTPGSNTPVCSGQTLSLTSNTIASATYSWSGPNSFTSSLQNPPIANVTTAATGNYSISVTVSGCTSSTATTSVTINQTPAAPTAGSNSPLCANQTLNLTSSGSGSSYSWNGPNGFGSGLQNPTLANAQAVNAGTYSVTTTSGAGCISSVATTSVVINPIPSAPTPGSNTPVCSGQTLSLTSTTSAGATYNWIGPNSFTSSLQNPTIGNVTTAATGTYTINVTVSGCTSLNEVTSVTVNPTPAAPTAGSNSPMCTGTTLSLTASTISGATYSWSGPNGFTSSLQNPTLGNVSTSDGGTYSVTATVTGCSGSAGTTSVVISPPPATPTAGNSSPICAGYTLSLTANNIAGATYNWSGPNSFTSTNQNPTIASITTSGGGTYSVSVTVGGCTGSSGTTAVTVNVSPASPTPGSNSPVCSGNTLNLTATATGVSYNWSGPNSFTSTNQNPSISNATTAASGTYSVIATGGNGCVSTPANTISVTVNQTPSAPSASNDSPLCTGQTVSLTASTIAGATYSWSGPNSFTSTLQNPTIANLSTANEGTYSVTATVAGCTGPVGTTSVVINNTPPTPVASSNAPLCSGATMSLTANNISTATYQWNGPNSFTSSLQNPTIANVTTADAGSYSVTATVAGCVGAPGTTNVSISVNPVPPTPVVSSNSPICAGDNLSLTSNTIANVIYSWTGPNSFTSSLEDPSITAATTAAAGNYSLAVSYTTGCTSPTAVVVPAVVVNPIPAAPTAGSNGPLCTGVTLSLTASTISGATYSWIGPNSFTSSLQNPTRTNVAVADAGTYSVTATVTGCTSTAGTVSVAINPPQTPTVTNTSPVCTGNTLSLTANTVATATYSWSGPNSFTSSLQNPTIGNVTVAANGTYSVTINLGGCVGPVGVTTATVNVTPTTPTAGGNTPICEGGTLSLTATTVAGTNYSWSGPNSFTSSLQNPTPITNITTAEAGTYTVFVTSVANGCVSGTSTKTIVVNLIPASPAPASSNQPICSGQTLSLTATTVGGAIYNWNGPNSFSSTNQNPTISNATTAGTGTYSVTSTVSGCTSPAATTTVTINQTPSAPSASSNSPVCSGNNLSLTASSVGSTYNWNGPNNFTSTVQNPLINGATSADAGTYSVTATSAAGCIGSAGTVAVTITPLPSAPTPGSNSPVCSGNILSLTASTITSATYLWSGPNSFTSSLQNPTITNVSTAADGTYSVSATVNGCAGPIGTVSVTINQTPSAPTAGSNSPVCSGNILSLTASSVGSTYNWIGPNGFTAASQNPTITNITTAGNGTYSVTATANGCTGAAGTVVVTINQTPSSPVAGNNSTICSGQTLSLTASTISGATYSWSGPNNFTSSLQNPTISGVATSDAGTYTVNATVSGCVGTDATTTATINQTPSAPTAGDNSPVCSGKTLSLTASTISGATYNWNGPNSFSSSSQNPTISNVTTAANGNYSVTASAGGCTSTTGITSVTVNPTPAISANANSSVCAGSTLSLSATTIAGATYAWNGPNNFTSALQNPTIASVTTADAGNYSVTATSGAGCVGNTAIKNVIVTASISVNAGADQTVCANNNNTSLSGTVSGGTNTGIWSSSGSGGFIPGNTALNAFYLPSNADTAAGTITLTLTSTNNGGCTATSDAMILTITDAPAANAGADQTVCANNADVSLNGGVNDAATGGTWASLGTGTFTPNANTLNAVYHSSAADTTAGTVTLVLTTTGIGSCNPTTDTMIVKITHAPTVNAGADISVCSNNANASLNGSSSTGSGTWTTLGSGTFNPNANTLNATYVPSAGDISSGSVDLILTTTGNGLCTAEKDTVAVIFTAPPTVNAGSDVTVCSNNNTVTLTGTSSTGSGTWTSSGTGTFSPNANTLNASYTPSAADNSAGSVALTLSSANNGGCLTVTDQMTITITPGPTANAGANQTVCANNSVVTLSGSFTVASGAGWTSSGTGSFSPNNTTMNATYTPSAADISTGSVTITLTTTGNGLCIAASSTMTITINPAPVVNTGGNTVACKNNPNVSLNGTSTTGSGSWTTSGSGTFSPNANTLNATYQSSNADTTAGSVTLTLTSTNNGLCVAVSNTMIITYIAKPIVFAGNDTTVCANNDTVSLSGSSNTGSGQWTTSGTGTFTNATTLSTKYVPSTTDISTGSVTITLASTNNGTCNPVTDAMVVSFTSAPTVNAGTDQTVCGNNSVVTLNGSFTVSAGAGWTTLGTGTFAPDTATMNATYIPSTTDTAAGNVTLVLTTTGNGGCLAETDTMKITITDAPNVTAGADQFVCLSNPVAALNGSTTTGSGTWSTLGSGTFANANALATTYTASTADTTAGSIQLVLTSTNNASCNAVTDTILLTFTPIPTVNAGSDVTVCANNSTVTLTGTSSTGAGMWASSGTGSFGNSSSLTTTYVPSILDASAGSVGIALTSVNGCTAITDSMYIIITLSPVVDAGPFQSVCSGTMSAVLQGNISGGASTGVWSTSGSGTFTPNNTDLNATYNLSAADSAAGVITITLTSSNNGNCNPVSDITKITVVPGPIAYAGVDTTICGYVLTLKGSVTGVSGTGMWQTLLPNDGTFSPNDSALNAVFTGITGDAQATLILTSTNNGPCAASKDTMRVTFTPPPVANAGADTSICKNNLVINLNGQVTNSPGGHWTTLGTGTFSPHPDSLDASYIPSSADTAAGTVTVVLTTTGQTVCASVSDTMVITFTGPPVVNAGADIKVCQGSVIAALNGSVAGATTTGQWSTLGSGTFSPNDSALAGNYILSTPDTSAGGTTLVLISTHNGNCLAVTDTVKITINPVPVVNAGPDLTVCANNGTIALAGNVTVGSTTGYWTTNENGTFFPDSSALNAIYNPGTADTTAGSATLVLTSTKGCRAVTDTMILTITHAPFVNAGNDTAICEGQSLMLNGSTNSISTGAVWTTNGTGTFSPNDSALNAMYVPTTADAVAGKVTLTLTSTGNGQCLAVSDSMKITIGRAPIAGFSFTKICTGQAISFTDTSSVAISTDTIVSWNWTINGGNLSQQNPLYTYSVNGTDSVVLVVTTKIGCTDTASHVVNINSTPVANFGFTTNCLSDSVYFTDSSSVSPGNIISWNWNFGDGNNSSVQNPTHVYAVNGTYTVMLTVSSDSGCNSTFTLPVNPGKPVVAGFTSSSATTCTGQLVSFTDTSFAMNDSIVAWNWTIGGTILTTQNPSFTYSVAGTDTVKLVAFASSGCSDSAMQVITIHPSPNALFGYVTTCHSDSVYFSDSSSVSPGNIISWNWNFGDGNNSMLQNPVHSYSLNGTYVVSLTVASDSGCTATYTTSVTPGQPVLANFNYSSTCTGQSVTFTDASVVNANDSITAWHWTVNGNIFTTQNVNYTYSVSGTDTVMLIVIAKSGCSDTVSQVINIHPTPVASFSIQTSCTNDSVYFTSTSTVSSGIISSWSWNFGDANTSVIQNPVHYYDSVNVYLVSLTVTSDSGCAATYTMNVTPAKGLFAGFSQKNNCDLSFTFSDTSLIATGDSITSCFWNFGDGNTSNSSCNPTHLYASAGTYTVTHLVTSKGGCTDSTTDVITISPLPKADFSPKSGTYNIGTTIDFADQSQNAITWMWNFGDGNSSTVENPSHQYMQDGILDVMLIITNNNGCPDTAKYTFILNSNVVAVPSAFTPNGDGHNDYLKVRGGPLKEVDFRIYNEWGNELYRASTPEEAQQKGWDGTYHGKAQPSSRYVYTLTGETYNGDKINMKGNVTIIR